MTRTWSEALSVALGPPEEMPALTWIRLNRTLDHPLAYRPKTNCEPRMSANLVMNDAAILTDRRHLDTQRVTDSAATLARTNQSDQGNLLAHGFTVLPS
jgi:hypothetical protein